MSERVRKLATLRTAALVFAAGWALFWCAALGLPHALPLWIPLLLLASGIILIPIAKRSEAARAAPRVALRPPASLVPDLAPDPSK